MAEKVQQSKDNQRRAIEALQALIAFGNLPGNEPAEGLTTLRMNMIDLLTNLAHLCDREGLSLPQIQETAASHYREETSQLGTQFDDFPRG